MKKIIALLLVVALTATVSIAGTTAYLQSEDSDVNVMTLGNVKIDQHEYERVVGENGNYTTTEIDGVTSYVLQDFTQAKPLYPIVGDPNEPGNSPAYAGYDNTIVRMTQVGSYGSMQVFAGKNAQDKFVTVENTGKSDAYVRTIVAIEVGATDGTKIMNSSRAGDEPAPWIANGVGIVSIGGNNYKVIEYVYRGASDVSRHVNGILPAGDTTYPSFCQVYLKHNATNEDMEAIDGNGNGTLDILVLSQAVQTQGFADAKTALDTAFGKPSEKAAEWFAGMEAPTLVYTADELIEALEAGKDVILDSDVKIEPANMSNAYGKTGINVKNGQRINGNGHTLDIQGAGGTWDSGINTTGGVIENIKITGSFRGVFVNHTSTHSERVILNNVTLDGTTYTISCDQGLNQGLTANNSTFNGWTSYAATIGDVIFNGCKFGAGNGYAYCRPYAPTTFVGCEFAAGYQLDPRAAVTFENCTIGGVALTAENLATLVTSNIANATVK